MEILEGSFLAKKIGPMPTWAWMAVGLGAAIAFKSYQANKAKGAQNGTTDPNGVQLIGGDQAPPVVFQSYTTVNTPITVPPGAGRMGPPSAPPTHGVPVGENPVPIAMPTPAPGSAPPPVASPPGQWVTVSKFTSNNPPWNSTLWGIAQKTKGNGSQWTSIWNAPANASLKARRKDPKLIQPGDKVFVPA